jgi:hypothetical protein
MRAVLLGTLLGMLGCGSEVIDSLRTTGVMDASSQEAAVATPQPDGAQGKSALAYYAFDEGTGSVVHDDSGHGHDGSLLGGEWIPAGRFGGAIRFSAPDGGAGGGVLVDPFPQPVKDWSVSFWVLVNGSDVTGTTTVLSTEIVMAGGWEMNLKPGDSTFAAAELGFWVGSSYSTASCTCVTLGSWTHIVAVVDGTTLTAQLFHDGVAASSATAQGAFVLGNPYLYMGRWGGGTDRLLVGGLDEVAIFDRALSAAEVTELYAGVVP